MSCENHPLGYSLELPEDSNYDTDNDDLAESKYSDVPLSLGNEFLFIYDEKTIDKTERNELHSGVVYN